jgi:hypothetical protein
MAMNNAGSTSEAELLLLVLLSREPLRGPREEEARKGDREESPTAIGPISRERGHHTRAERERMRCQT